MKKSESLIFSIIFNYFSIRYLNRCTIRIGTFAFAGMMLVSNSSTGQNSEYVFSHLNVNNGLSQNQINYIYRDHKGFVWFGTNAGLNRFDGSSFEIFSSQNPVNGAIINNNVNAIAEDKEGNIWIGTSGGVSILDGQIYKFRNPNYSSATRYNCGDVLYVNAIASVKNGDIWIGTNNGYFINDITNHSIRHLLVDSTNCNSPLNGITSIVEDRNSNIWMSSKNGFILRYSPQLKSIEKFKIPDKSDELANSVTHLFIDRDNDLWVGNLYGLYLFDIKKGGWNYDFKTKTDYFEGLKRIGTVSQNIDNLIWIAADGGGAFVVDKKGWKITNIKHQPFDDQQLSSNGLSFVHCDKDGIVWLGTTKKGVNFYKKKHQ